MGADAAPARDPAVGRHPPLMPMQCYRREQVATRKSCNSNPVILLMACLPFMRGRSSLLHWARNNRPSGSLGKLKWSTEEDESGVGMLSFLAKLGPLGQLPTGKQREA